MYRSRSRARKTSFSSAEADMSSHTKSLPKPMKMGTICRLPHKSATYTTKPLLGSSLIGKTRMRRVIDQITSAKKRSMRRKISKPVINKPTLTPNEMLARLQGSRLPSSAYRNPNTIPAIGFKPINICQRRGR